jgi:hypothetical protein
MNKLYILLSISVLLSATCNKKTMKKEIIKFDLCLQINVVSSDIVGYGEVFFCKVAHVKKGVLDDTTIRLVVLAANKELNQTLAKAGQATIEAGFNKKKKNEPYGIMPINGFVDAGKTSWEIVFANKISERNPQ